MQAAQGGKFERLKPVFDPLFVYVLELVPHVARLPFRVLADRRNDERLDFRLAVDAALAALALAVVAREPRRAFRLDRTLPVEQGIFADVRDRFPKPCLGLDLPGIPANRKGFHATRLRKPGGFSKHPVQEEERGLRLGAGLAVPGKPGRKRQGNGGGSLDRDRRKRGHLGGNGEAGIFRHGVDEPLAPAPASGAGTGLPAFTFRKVENRAFGKP